MSEQPESGRSASQVGRQDGGVRRRGRYSRRAVMLGAAAAGAGATAALASGSPAQATSRANGSPVELGQTNNASATTWVITSSGTGLAGQTATQKASGVAGIDTGTSGSGHGTYGSSVTGTGVYGTSTSGTGVFANSKDGVGLFAASTNGVALEVQGPAAFLNSGLVAVKKGSKTLTVMVPGTTTSSIVLATIQRPQSGVYLEAAAPGSGSFTITLSKAATADLLVGWFMLG